MDLNITGISSSLGDSVKNRFGKTILPIKDLVSQGLSTSGYHKFRHDMIIDYTWSGNSGAHHAKFGVTSGNSSEPVSYVIDSENSISGLQSGSATFKMTVDYPSGETFGQLNFIQDNIPNFIEAKGITVTGNSANEHYVTGNTYTSEDFITRPPVGNAISNEYVLIEGYENLEPEYLAVYVGGKPTEGYVNTSGDIYVEIPPFESSNKNVCLEIENGVNRITGGYLELVFIPEILRTMPSAASWGDTVTVSGKNFVDVTGVFINDIQISSFTNPNDNEITFTIPNTTVGNYDIKICATGGCSL
jgi:hypothetical protein